MLTRLLIALAMIQGPNPPDTALPDMNHMVREGMVNPLRATHTVEWACGKSGKRSRIVVSVEDTGTGARNERFTVKLLDLVVSGRATRRSGF